METRICSWCGDKVGEKEWCPRCTERLTKNVPDPSTMTADERADELASLSPCLEVKFSLLHQRIEALAGRPVWTRELANYAAIIRQVREGRGPTREEFNDPLGDHGTIVVEI